MLSVGRIYIVGYMGSGKTTVGKKLASALNWSFIDLDEKIVRSTGKTIPELFSEYGEDYFREVESEVLRSLDSSGGSVISTGGGTPCFRNNMRYMLDTGFTIYLEMTPGQLKSRLEGTSGERPLLMSIGDEKLVDYISRTLGEREKWYRMAEMITNGLNIDISTLIVELKDRLHN